MLPLHTRLDLLSRLGDYLLTDAPAWLEAKARATAANPWFTPESIDAAVQAIAGNYLQRSKLEAWMAGYTLPPTARKVGIVMAGNIPLVGFHDFLCGFVCGHNLYLKPSSKDEVLLRHVLDVLNEWEPQTKEAVHISEMLKGCEAYIATGSNNSARYFEQYFAKHPHLIRRSRTSVTLLHGDESVEELNALADDVFTHYGLGCRNVTQVLVPEGYDFEPLLSTLKRYEDLMQHHKYKNNYDYHLALYLLNRVPYLTNESVLLVENALPFSAVATLHYRYYTDREAALAALRASADIQTVIGRDGLPFGSAQKPQLDQYADGADTMAFLCSL